jgi:hypothetical protein
VDAAPGRNEELVGRLGEDLADPPPEPHVLLPTENVSLLT